MVEISLDLVMIILKQLVSAKGEGGEGETWGNLSNFRLSNPLLFYRCDGAGLSWGEVCDWNYQWESDWENDQRSEMKKY